MAVGPTRLQLMHLSVLRDFIDLEFRSLDPARQPPEVSLPPCQNGARADDGFASLLSSTRAGPCSPLSLERPHAQTAGVLPFPYRLERVVDDLILICYLVGNDFLPNLPTLYIPNGGLPAVFEAYKRTLPTLGAGDTAVGGPGARASG